MHRAPILLQLLLALLLLAGCAGLPVPAGEACVARAFVVTDDFAGARRGACTVRGAGRVRLEIVREHEQVTNPSPWFAFRLEPSRHGIATVELDYGDWEHRYVPKLSYDGRTWTPLDEKALEVSDDGRFARVSIELRDDPVWIAAQELLLPGDYDRWMHDTAASGAMTLEELGRSLQGEAIRLLDSRGDSADVVLLVGRQHPPEVSGAFALFAFVEEMMSASPTAARFRERFRIVAVPLLNPDGVLQGNWRGNSNGVDLNRDWGLFAQTETSLVARLLDELERDGSDIVLFVDFHSTKRNLFYTPAADDDSHAARFIDTWFDRARPRLADYEFSNEIRPTTDTPNGKNYMFKRYGVPSLTYEVGDETDRAAAAAAARVFAEELMRLMLEEARVSDTR